MKNAVQTNILTFGIKASQMTGYTTVYVTPVTSNRHYEKLDKSTV
jgi:hypothetical protein